MQHAWLFLKELDFNACVRKDLVAQHVAQVRLAYNPLRWAVFDIQSDAEISINGQKAIDKWIFLISRPTKSAHYLYVFSGRTEVFRENDIYVAAIISNIVIK